MNTRHVALLIEDEELAAEELCEIVRAMGHEGIHVTNREDAVRIFQERLVCYVVADMCIKSTPESVLPRPEAGWSTIEDLRRLAPGHRGRHHDVPILLHSGHVTSLLDVVRSVRDGGDDFIPKRAPGVSLRDQISTALKQCGRTCHDRCAAISEGARAPREDGAVSLSITGKTRRKKHEILVNERSVCLPEQRVALLLRFVAARVSGAHDGWIDVGTLGEHAARRVSHLKEALAPILPNDLELIANDKNGGYRLDPSIVVAHIDWPALAKNGKEIGRIAGQVTVVTRGISAAQKSRRVS